MWKHAADGTMTKASVVTSYVRVYFRYATKPASNDEDFVSIADNSSATKIYVSLTSGGKIKVYDNTFTAISTGATVLSANTWYRIEVKCGTGANALWEVKIDGTSEVSGTSSNLGNNNAGEIYVGRVTLSGFSNSTDFFYDDFYWDDAAYPGAGQCAIQKTMADGSAYTGWTKDLFSATKWQAVNEVPNDGNTTYISTSTQNDAYTAAMDSTSTAGISGTINCQKTIAISSDLSSSSTVLTRLHSGATDSDTTAPTLTSSFISSVKLNPTDPNTGSAWTLSALDSIECGVKKTDAGISSPHCTAIYSMVDYTPGAAAATRHSLPYLGVG
jgi:hypothetical protein